MAIVLNRTTNELRHSANTPDFPVQDWIINPDLSAVVGFGTQYWIVTVDVVTLMDQAARDAVDAAQVAAIVQAHRDEATGRTREASGVGVEIRAIFGAIVKQQHKANNRIQELQNDMIAMKASTGGTANVRDAISGAYLNINNQARSALIQEYKDEINAGDAD